MRLFGELSELQDIQWRQNGQAVVLEPNAGITYTATRTFQLPPIDANQILVGATATQALTNKVIDASVNTLTNIDLTSAVTGILPKTNGGTGITSTATFPASGVVVTEAATETLSNKTLGLTNTILVVDNNLHIASSVDNTRLIEFDASSISPGTTRTFSFPNANALLASTSTVQTISNKTYIAPAVSDFIDFTEISTPATPASLHNRIYFKSDNFAYTLNSSGVESRLGSGSGDGFKNYISNPNDAANWSASGAGVTVATSTSTSRPDNITQANAIAITRVSGTTAYAFTRWTLDVADYNKMLQILLDETYAGTAGDYTLQIWSNTAANYSGTYTQLVTPVTNIPASTGSTFNTTFISSGSTAPYLELRIVAAAGTTPLYLNNVTVTPGQVVQGAAVGDWQSYTPTFGGMGTVTGPGFFWRRVGSNMEIQGHFQTGTVSSVSQAFISLPLSLNVNTSVISSLIYQMGKYVRLSSAATNLITSNQQGDVVYSAAVGAGFITLANSVGSNIYVTPAADQMLSNTQFVAMSASVPIAEWAGGGTLNMGQGAQVEYASSTTGTWDAAAAAVNTIAGPSGSPISGSLTGDRNKVVQLQYPIQTGDLLTLQYHVTGTTIWVDSGDSIYAVQNLPTIAFGGNLSNATVGSSLVNVQFHQYAAPGTLYNSSTGAQNWGPVYDAWRIRKVQASSPVGFGLATSTAAGLYQAGAAPGQATNATIAAGNIGEVISNNPSGSVALAASATYTAITSVNLTAGVWALSGAGQLMVSTLSGSTFFTMAISTSPTSVDSFSVGGVASLTGQASQIGTGNNGIYPVGTRFFRLAAPTTIYLVGQVTYTSQSGTTWGTSSVLNAVRIA